MTEFPAIDLPDIGNISAAHRSPIVNIPSNIKYGTFPDWFRFK